MIDIIIPVLSRPWAVAQLLENLHSATTTPYRVLFVCSAGDDEEITAIEREGAEYLLVDLPPADGQYAKKINRALNTGWGEWIFLGADDVTFHPRWDQHALDCAGDTYHVVATDDLANYFVRQGLLATHPLVRRSYILEQGGSLDGPGLVYHEGYSHNFVDCELSVLARSRGVYVFCRDARVEHRHPAFKSAQMDSTYEYGMRDFARDRALFCDRMAGYSQDPLVRRFIRAEMQLRRRA